MGQDESKGVGDQSPRTPQTPRRSFGKFTRKLGGSSSSFNLAASPLAPPDVHQSNSDFNFETHTTPRNTSSEKKSKTPPAKPVRRVSLSNTREEQSGETHSAHSSSLPPEMVLGNFRLGSQMSYRAPNEERCILSDTAEVSQGSSVNPEVRKTLQQKSSESVYLSSEDISLQLFRKEVYDDSDNAGNFDQSTIRNRPETIPHWETSDYNVSSRLQQLNLYNPSFDLIDLSDPEDESAWPLPPQIDKLPGKSGQGQTQSTFGSSFLNRNKSFELLLHEDESQPENESSNLDQIFASRNLFGVNASDYPFSGESLPIFGLYSSRQPDSDCGTALDYINETDEAEPNLMIQDSGSVDLLQFSSTEQLDEPENYPRRKSTEIPKTEQVLKEFDVYQESAYPRSESDYNLKDNQGVQEPCDVDFSRNQRSSSVFSPASSTDGIYDLTLSVFHKDSPQETRRKEIQDMKYCDLQGKSLVLKTPDYELDAPVGYPNTQRDNYQPSSISDSNLDDEVAKTGQMGVEKKEILQDLVEDDLPLNLAVRTLKDEEVKRKTGSLKLFEEVEKDCMENESDVEAVQISATQNESVIETSNEDQNDNSESSKERHFGSDESVDANSMKFETPKPGKVDSNNGFATVTRPPRHQAPKTVTKSKPETLAVQTDLENSEKQYQYESGNTNTFVRRKSPTSKADSKLSNAASYEQLENPTGTFVRRKSQLKLPTNFKRAPHTDDSTVDDETVPQTTDPVGMSTDTFVRPKKKTEKSSKLLNDAPHRNLQLSKFEECPKPFGDQAEVKGFQLSNAEGQIMGSNMSELNRIILDMAAQAVVRKAEEIEQFVSNKRKLLKELSVVNEEIIEDVWTIEENFSELHKKYDLIKLHYPHFKSSAIDAKQYLCSLLKHIEEQRLMRQQLTNEIEEQLLTGREKSEKVCESLNLKVSQLKAEIELQKLKNSQLTDKVAQKELENSQVAKLCDEMITKLNNAKSEPSTPS